jgi:hypothetical protein
MRRGPPRPQMHGPAEYERTVRFLAEFSNGVLVRSGKRRPKMDFTAECWLRHVVQREPLRCIGSAF